MKRLLGLLLACLFVVICFQWSTHNYKNLDCETRFALEEWYTIKYGDTSLKNATFTLDEIKGGMAAACVE